LGPQARPLNLQCSYIGQAVRQCRRQGVAKSRMSENRTDWGFRMHAPIALLCQQLQHVLGFICAQACI
jgi:hypothetical protein